MPRVVNAAGFVAVIGETPISSESYHVRDSNECVALLAPASNRVLRPGRGIGYDGGGGERGKSGDAKKSKTYAYFERVIWVYIFSSLANLDLRQ